MTAYANGHRLDAPPPLPAPPVAPPRLSLIELVLSGALRVGTPLGSPK